MPTTPQTRSWLAQFAAAAVVTSAVIMLLGYRLAFDVPVKDLLAPWGATLLLTALFTPVLLWARTRPQERPAPLLVAIAFGAYFSAFCLVLLYYAIRFGLIAKSDALSFVLATVAALPVAVAGGYYGYRSATRRRNDGPRAS